MGISNLTVALIDEALSITTEPLVCDQIECHPFLDQSKVIAACRANDMAVGAYSRIARGAVRNDEVLVRIGATYKKTAAQICLRYLVQQNIVVIPRTSKLERLSENAAIFDFALSNEDMAEIAALASPGGRLVDWAYSGRTKWDLPRLGHRQFKIAAVQPGPFADRFRADNRQGIFTGVGASRRDVRGVAA